MRYMFLIYSREMEADAPGRADSEAQMQAHMAVMKETTEKGVLRGAEPLKPTSTATTVRMKEDGTPLITDGPFAETKEQLAGYYIIDCENLDEAIEWAKKIPKACKGGEGCIEIRPLGLVPRP